MLCPCGAPAAGGHERELGLLATEMRAGIAASAGSIATHGTPALLSSSARDCCVLKAMRNFARTRRELAMAGALASLPSWYAGLRAWHRQHRRMGRRVCDCVSYVRGELAHYVTVRSQTFATRHPSRQSMGAAPVHGSRPMYGRVRRKPCVEASSESSATPATAWRREVRRPVGRGVSERLRTPLSAETSAFTLGT